MFVAVGYSKVNAVRAEKFAAARAKGYRIATYLSSRATIFAGFEPKENCFILEDNTIQPFASIGTVLDSRHSPQRLKLVAGAGYGGYESPPVRRAFRFSRGMRSTGAIAAVPPLRGRSAISRIACGRAR